MKKLIVVLLFFCIATMSLNLFAEEGKKENSVFSKFKAKFYGFIKADIIYDDSQTYFGKVNFWANSETGVSDDQFNFTMNQTRLGFSVQGPPILKGIPAGVIEMDFYGGGNDNTPHPRLYRAFIEIGWKNFLVLIGQDWDTHSLLYPTCLNFAYLSGAGNTQFRRPQLRVVKWIPLAQNYKLSFAAAIAHTTSPDLDGNGINDGTDNGWPSFQGRFAFEGKIFQNHPLTLAFSGHYGREEVDWGAPGSNVGYDSYSMVGEIIIPIGKFAHIKGEFFYGSNLDAYFGGIVQGIDPTTQLAIKAMGGWGQLSVPITKSLTVNAGGGTDRPYDAHISDGSRSENNVWFGNAYYSLSKNFIAAFEYSYMSTKYKNAPNGDDNRYHTSFIYSF